MWYMRRLHWGGRGSKERILHEVVDTDKERGIMSPNKFARRHLCMAPEAALSLSDSVEAHLSIRRDAHTEPTQGDGVGRHPGAQQRDGHLYRARLKGGPQVA